MIPLKNSIAVGLSVLLTACVGSVAQDGQPDAGDAPDAEPPPRDVAEQLFRDNVRPTLEAKCSGNGCHAGTNPNPLKFMGQSEGYADYTVITTLGSITGNGNPNNAALLTKIAGGHLGLSYTDQEEQAIVDWLNELEPDPNAVDTLMQWSSCMTKYPNDWTMSNMPSWAEKNHQGVGGCANCHGNSLSNFNTALDDDDMLLKNSCEQFITGFFSIDVANGNEVVPAYGKLNSKGNGSDLHPVYVTGSADTHYEYLEDYYDRIKAHIDAGDCPPEDAAYPAPELCGP